MTDNTAATPHRLPNRAHARADHGDHRMTIDLTHLHADELGMIGYTIRCWAVVLGDAMYPVADRVADDGVLTVDDLDGLADWQLLLVANAVGAWDSTAAGQLRHLAGAADTQKTWESRDHDPPPHVHRHQWQVEDYVCECGDVLARGLWR